MENDTVAGAITYEVAPWVEYEIRDSVFYAKGEGWEHAPAWGIAFEGDTKRLPVSQYEDIQPSNPYIGIYHPMPDKRLSSSCTATGE